jgi:hypothetical protein
VCYIFWLGGLDCGYLLMSYGLEPLGSGVNILVDFAGDEARDTALRPWTRFLSQDIFLESCVDIASRRLDEKNRCTAMVVMVKKSRQRYSAQFLVGRRFSLGVEAGYCWLPRLAASRASQDNCGGAIRAA